MKKIGIIILTIISFSCSSQNKTIKQDSFKKIIIVLDNKSNFKQFVTKNDTLNLNTFYFSWPSLVNFKENEFIFDKNDKIISTRVIIKGRDHKLSLRSEDELTISKSDLENDFTKIFLSDFIYFKYDNLLKGLKSSGNIVYVTKDISNTNVNIYKCEFIE